MNFSFLNLILIFCENVSVFIKYISFIFIWKKKIKERSAVSKAYCRLKLNLSFQCLKQRGSLLPLKVSLQVSLQTEVWRLVSATLDSAVHQGQRWHSMGLLTSLSWSQDTSYTDCHFVHSQQKKSNHISLSRIVSNAFFGFKRGWVWNVFVFRPIKYT